MIKKHPSQAILKELLEYDPLTGKLFWKRRDHHWFASGKHSQTHSANTWNGRYAGTEAFASKNGHGYFQGSIFKRKYEAHRVIWAMITGEWPETVDHEDGNVTNNKWQNLKGKTRSSNQRNLGLRKDNTTGFTGVVLNSNGKWRAMIMVGRKCKTLGLFETKEEAISCRLAANEKFGFHKNHGMRKSTAARNMEAAA